MRLGREWPQRVTIALTTLLIFARALPYPLQRSWDDGRFILDNADVRGASFGALWRMFTQVQFEAYHPLHLLSYWLDVPWFGPRPFLVHGVSLGLWLFALLLVYELLRALDVPAWIAVLGSLACGVHPVQVEAVCWASGRKDVLALLLSAASLRAQLRAQSASDRSAWTARAFYGLALLAKTTALPLPLFALVLDVHVRRIPFRVAARRQVPSVLLGALVAGCVVYIWGEHAMLRDTVGGIALAPVRFVQTLGHGLLTLVWPASTAPMYPTFEVVAWNVSRGLACAVVALACWVSYKHGPRLVFAGLVGFVGLALPICNVVPMYFPFQDRYLSLPLLPLCIAFCGALAALQRARALRTARTASVVVSSVAIAALGVRCIQYQGAWSSELRLWGHAASTQPASDYAWLKLGEVRRDAGQLEGAIMAYQGVVHAAPTRKLAHAALFEAVALRDERNAHRQPSQARVLAQRYYELLDHPDTLHRFSQNLSAQGYSRAAELPLQLALLREPMPDAALQSMALTALRANQVSLAVFYAGLMRQPVSAEPLAKLLRQPHFSVVP
jgi:hypothetical protein